jgi:hypothetical protein
VSEGTTCLAAGAQVLDEVNVLEGAGLVATAAVIRASGLGDRCHEVDVAFSQITGPALVLGGTGRVPAESRPTLGMGPEPSPLGSNGEHGGQVTVRGRGCPVRPDDRA